MIRLFIIRKLIETHKLGPKTRNLTMNVFSHAGTKADPTWYDNFDFWEAYDMDNERREQKKPRNWEDIFVMSDFARKTCIWRVPISEIRRLFLVSHSDYPSFRMTYNPNKKDYDLSTD